MHGTNETIVSRVIAEYREMPGLKLAPAQASRLWGMDRELCERLLELLRRQTLGPKMETAVRVAIGAQSVHPP